MYLHIGGNKVIPLKEIVAILDYEKFNRSAINKEFLAINSHKLPKKKGPIKSFIITTNKKIYHSPISSTTLAKRATVLSKGYIAQDISLMIYSSLKE